MDLMEIIIFSALFIIPFLRPCQSKGGSNNLTLPLHRLLDLFLSPEWGKGLPKLNGPKMLKYFLFWSP